MMHRSPSPPFVIELKEKIMTTSTKTTKLGSPVADAIASQNAAIDAALRDNFNRTVAMFERVRAMFTQQRATRQAYRELSELNDRELADLGIARSDIRNVVRGKFPSRV
jgi:uncharacterized protein YjiS (DUF1127 family)